MENLGRELEQITQRTAALGWTLQQGMDGLLEENAEEVSTMVLVGCILAHKTFPLHVVRGILLNARVFEPMIEIGELVPNYFLFEFSSKETRDRVYDRQPWNVKGFSLILKPWPPGLPCHEVDLTTFPAWVQIHGLPLEKSNETMA